MDLRAQKTTPFKHLNVLRRFQLKCLGKLNTNIARFV